MQAIANYWFERQRLGRDAVATCMAELEAILESWLESKGASLPLQKSGDFASRTQGGEGRYACDRYAHEDSALYELVLEENARGGQEFTTRVAILGTATAVRAFVSLQATGTGSMIAPSFIEAHCPRCVREMLGKYPDWTRSAEKVPGRLIELLGDEGGGLLAKKIRNPKRVHPIVAVSKIDDEELWSGLGERIARDLVGLAQVIVIDDEASIRLSEELGRINSCYLGAVRLYWPLTRGAERIDSQVWTASRLLPSDESEDARAQHRFCAQLRYRLMSASAMSTSMPKQIQEVRDAEARRRLHELRQKGQTAAEAEALVEMLIAEKKAVIAEKKELERQLVQAKADIFSLRSRIETLTAGAAHPEHGDAAEGAAQVERSPPAEGEIRFYKKVSTASNYDILVQIDDCGHHAWQNSAKADKAKKGIIRLEKTDAWKLVQHCGSCTGGGVWRVKW